MTEKTKYTAFRCPEELLEPLKLKAKKDRRSMSGYIIKLIAEDVKDELAARHASQSADK